MNYYSPTYIPSSPDAHAVVKAMENDLDRRKSSIKGATSEELEQVLASFVTFHKQPYEVMLKHSPERLKDTVKDSLECLVKAGWLQRTEGKYGHRLNPDKDYGHIKTTTKKDLGRYFFQTATHCVVRDDSYKLRAREDLKRLNYNAVEYVEFPNGPAQVAILAGLIEAPSRRWRELDIKATLYQPDYEDFAQELEQHCWGTYHHPCLPYYDGFLTIHSFARTLRFSSLLLKRKYNTRGELHAQVTDGYGRTISKWGCVV